MEDYKHFAVGEVVGMYGTTNGRSCNRHACCGREVLEIGSIVQFNTAQTEIDGDIRPGIAARHIIHGELRCIIGFLSRAIVIRSKGMLEGKQAQIIEFYKDNPNNTKRRKGYQCVGVARYRLLDQLLEDWFFM